MFAIDESSAWTSPAVLAELAAAAGSTEAVVGPDGRCTYLELATACAGLGSALRGAGLRPGDRIGVLLPNGVRWCTAALGAHAAGLGVVPISTWSRSLELGDVVRRAGLRAIVADRLIFDHDFSTDLEAIGDGCARTDFLGTFWWPRGQAWPDGLSPDLAADPVVELRACPVTEEDEAFVLFTSGSTAAPKAVPLRHGGLMRNGHAVGSRHHAVQGDRIWLASPLFFVFGCANALPNAMTHAATLCTQDRFEPERALRFIATERCTLYYGVPTMTRALAAYPDLGSYDISSLRSGSTAFTAEDVRLANDVLGVAKVCSAYGMTEGYGHTTMTDADDPREVRLSTQGRPLPTQEIQILTADGDVAGPGELGLVRIRGCVTSGYLDAPELNAAAFDSDGWFTTGDVGMIDEDGNFRFVGRRDEMLKINGINISPSEVEAVLVGHDRVEQAFAFGVPSGGETVLGCVLVSVDGGDGDVLAAEVTAWARERASNYKVPRIVRTMTASELPLTATGKVSRRLMSEWVLTTL